MEKLEDYGEQRIWKSFKNIMAGIDQKHEAS